MSLLSIKDFLEIVRHSGLQHITLTLEGWLSTVVLAFTLSRPPSQSVNWRGHVLSLSCFNYWQWRKSFCMTVKCQALRQNLQQFLEMFLFLKMLPSASAHVT
jgi:hypothetical protein